eukprot:scaffold9890_cov159-Amphora_coffeaeformis.AAC.5
MQSQSSVDVRGGVLFAKKSDLMGNVGCCGRSMVDMRLLSIFWIGQNEAKLFFGLAGKRYYLKSSLVCQEDCAFKRDRDREATLR